MKKITEANKTADPKRADVLSRFVVGTNPKDRFRFKKRTIVLLIGTAFCIVIGIVIFSVLRPKAPAPAAESVKSLVEAGDSDEELGRVVKEYGTKYDKATKDVEKFDPIKWDKALLDKAYLSLLYADKIEAFNQVYTTLSLIEVAQSSGLDIDDNSYGITQSMRDAIKQRADAARDRQLGSAPEGVNPNE